MSRLAVVIVACSGCAQIFGIQPARLGDAGGDAPTGTRTIGGTVTGLLGAGLVLENNGSNDTLVISDGPFELATPVAAGSTYAVTVATQPSNPTQQCIVANGAGAANTNIADVQVSCTVSAFQIGGVIAGLTGSGLTLGNANDSVGTTATSFTFPTAVASGTGYNVVIKTQPNGQTCDVYGGTGTIGGGAVTSMLVDCSTSELAVAGTVSGLNGTVGLNATIGAGNTMATVTSNGTFAFPSTALNGQGYNVTVASQPMYPPATQTCIASNAAGTVTSSVTNIAVDCSTRVYSVGGTVAGLAGSLILHNNVADALTVTADGNFTFTTLVPSGSSYDVAVATQPQGQTCTISKGTGIIKSSAVVDVAVTCR